MFEGVARMDTVGQSDYNLSMRHMHYSPLPDTPRCPAVRGRITLDKGLPALVKLTPHCNPNLLLQLAICRVRVILYAVISRIRQGTQIFYYNLVGPELFITIGPVTPISTDCGRSFVRHS